MADETKIEIGCANFDALLADALDGALTGPKLEGFERHKATCKTCGPMFAEAEAGMNWLSKLDEVEPPQNLMHNILVATSGTAVATGIAEIAARRPWWERLRERMTPGLAPLMTPRFAMSFAMAFFSISMILSMTNVKLSDVRKMDLSSHGIRRTYNESEARVLRYYDNIRLVYEIESRVRDLKRAAGTEEKKETPKQPKENNSSGDPDRKQYQNYSREQNSMVMASLQMNTSLGRGRERA